MQFYRCLSRYAYAGFSQTLYFSVKCRPYLYPRYLGYTPLRLPNTCSLLPYGMVVERSSIRGFAADFPLKINRGFNLIYMQLIFSTFVTFTPRLISSLRCSPIAFRESQQFNVLFIMQITLHGDYYELISNCIQPLLHPPPQPHGLQSQGIVCTVVIEPSASLPIHALRPA